MFVKLTCQLKMLSLTLFLVVAKTATLTAFFLGNVLDGADVAFKHMFEIKLRQARHQNQGSNFGTDSYDDYYHLSCGGIANSSLSLRSNSDDILHRARDILAQWALDRDVQTSLQRSAGLYQGCLAVAKEAHKDVGAPAHFLT